MSAVPNDIPVVAEPGSGRSEQLPRNARLYFLLVAAATAAATLPFMGRLQNTHHWLAFFILGTAAATAQLFRVQTPRDQAYHTAIVFVIAAAFVLPPELVALMGIVQHIPEWLKIRYRWYLQTFNICNYVLASMAVWFLAHRLMGWSAISDRTLRVAVAGLVCSIVFVAINHTVLALMLHFARGHTLRETGLFEVEHFSTDLVLAALGVATFAFWESNPWLIPFSIAPLVLVHRSLAVPQLQAEARVDPKTGLFNARHFATALSEEIGRAQRFERPMSLIMADLDLLRDINNSYGHLAGDAVLQGIADVFRAQLRHYDVPARFGGEEFSILLPETPPDQAMEIAERIRRAVAQRRFDVETSSEPIRATVSIGVAGFPKDGTDANELIHQADLAVYRAKLQGRNRVLSASSEPLLVPSDRTARLIAVPEDDEPTPVHAPAPVQAKGEERSEDVRHPRPHAVHGPRFLSLDRRLSLTVGLVSALGVTAGVAGLALSWTSKDLLGLLAILLLVGVGQALALEADEGAAVLSVSAVGCLAASSLFGFRAALPLAITSVAVDWSARRHPLHNVLFNIGALTLASLTAASIFNLARFFPEGTPHRLAIAALGLLAGAGYFAVNMGLVSLALALQGHERWWGVFREQFAWLLPHYVVYGFIGGVMALAYEAVNLLALAVFAVPLLLMRKTQEAYLKHTHRSAQKLRQAAETIQSQNVSLEMANKLLKERSTAAMESLSATVDARDSYTAGHSRRVQQLALAIGRELGLSQAELDLLGHAALFHDIGKLAIPDAILLKPASLTPDEWALMQRHAEEGARIIDRLGFLNDAVPAIRHHHERFDGIGYPDRLAGEDIPLGARIIHVADALDSMLTTRIYRAARPAAEALQELRASAGTQFCPRCVGALERILPLDALRREDEPPRLSVAS
ncbi:MAG TPA: diguanylate cyclase [Gaiellaceae bacterium]|nr:diguanylate cyclase [Gaiellaceae bacterium]